MSNEKNYSATEIALGVSFIVVLLALSVAFFKFAQIEKFWRKRQEIVVVFSGVGKLTTDSPVRYNGLEIGRVKSMEPVHLDEKLIKTHFRTLQPLDINNLPIRADSIKREILEKPRAEFDKACRDRLVNSTMIKLVLEVLADNDPIRYHLDDEVRIVTTIFDDSVVEIISGSGELNVESQKQYLIGNPGDFFENLLMSMGEMKKIIGEVRDVLGEKELSNIQSFQSHFTPLNESFNKLTKTGSERMALTLKHFNELTQKSKTKLNEIGKVLESLEPAAQTTNENIQIAIKGIKAKAKVTEADVSAAIKETTAEYTATAEGAKVPLQQLRKGLDDVKADLFEAKTTVEKAPARLDAISDPLGSMSLQSENDMERFGKSVKKIVNNLKIAAYVAKENKDLMLGNRDVGEYAAQSMIDVQRRLGRISRRMRQSGADAVEAARDLEADMTAGPVIEKAEETARKLGELRVPIDELRDRADEIFIQPWRERKRASWQGDGPIRWEP